MKKLAFLLLFLPFLGLAQAATIADYNALSVNSKVGMWHHVEETLLLLSFILLPITNSLIFKYFKIKQVWITYAIITIYYMGFNTAF